MRGQLRLALVLAFGGTAIGCDAGPTEPDLEGPPTLLAAAPAVVDQPISGVAFISGLVDPGEERTTPAGTTHGRGLIIYVTMLGDVSGVVTFVQAYDWTPRGDGAIRGPFDGTVTWSGMSGDLSGRATLHMDDFFTGGTFVGHGSGGLDGHKFKFDFAGPLGGPFTFTGNVVSPASAR